MATTRLFSRSRPVRGFLSLSDRYLPYRLCQLFAPTALVPSCSILNSNTYASSALQYGMRIKDFTAIGFSKHLDEKIWNIRREESKKRAKIEGSPFTILEDHISTHNVCDNSSRKNLEEHLRGYKDINAWDKSKDLVKFSTEINSILRNKRLEEFQSSMTTDEIRNSVMRHLYVLALQEVIPSEKLYMEYLINEDKHDLVEYRWRYRDYKSLFRIYSKKFGMLPERCLRRGIELHLSRIPHKYCLRKYLPKVFRKELLRKLEDDHETLTLKIHDLPTISEEMMSCEIKSLVDHVPDANLSVEDPNSNCTRWWLGRPWFH